MIDQTVSLRTRLGAALAAVSVALAVGACGSGADANRPADPAASRPVEQPAPDPSKTACRSVAYIGDSTSLGLISPSYLPDPKQRIGARLGAVGAKDRRIDIAGARSVVETIPGTTNAQSAARAIRRSGFKGCWILALGTNEAADVAVGSVYSERKRIHLMMRIIAGEPVMWLNAKTLLGDGSPYDNRNVRNWNEALLAACPRYPEMRVFDWVREVKDGWYIDDGIHFTTPGYAQRSKLIAAALVSAFPSGTPIPGPDGAAGATGSTGVTGKKGVGTDTGAAIDRGSAETGGSCLVGPAPAVLRSPRQNLKRFLDGW